ncbi:MAG: hypothetical protein JW908_15080 [Anaerolineales bacterium]|nr:hypothetical protein [Anaerolineales bacterium]
MLTQRNFNSDASGENLFATCPFGNLLEAQFLVDGFVLPMLIDKISDDIVNATIDAFVHHSRQHQSQVVLIGCIDVIYCCC